jgi:hypothetical protein
MVAQNGTETAISSRCNDSCDPQTRVYATGRQRGAVAAFRRASKKVRPTTRLQL